MLSMFWGFTSALIFTKIKDDKMAVIFEQCLRSPAALRSVMILIIIILLPFVRGIYLFTQPLNDFFV